MRRRLHATGAKRGLEVPEHLVQTLAVALAMSACITGRKATAEALRHQIEELMAEAPDARMH